MLAPPPFVLRPRQRSGIFALTQGASFQILGEHAVCTRRIAVRPGFHPARRFQEARVSCFDEGLPVPRSWPLIETRYAHSLGDALGGNLSGQPVPKPMYKFGLTPGSAPCFVVVKEPEWRRETAFYKLLLSFGVQRMERRKDDRGSQDGQHAARGNTLCTTRPENLGTQRENRAKRSLPI